MIEKEIIENIHRGIDGELTPAELEELERNLTRHPESERLYKELATLGQRLKHEPEQMHDIDLKQEILKRINMEAYTPKEKKQEIKVIRSFWTRPAVRFSFVFIFGIFVGMLLLTLLKVDLTGSRVTQSEVKGTFYDSRSFNEMKPADVLQYESPLAKAICNVRYSTKVVEIRLDLSSLYPVKATIQFDFNNFEVLNAQNVSVNDQTTAIAAANYIQINNTGDNKFIFQLYNKNSLPHFLDFKILQNDMPIYQNSVQVNKE